MSSDDNGGPAFPTSMIEGPGYTKGMSLRDYYRGKIISTFSFAVLNLDEEGKVITEYDEDFVNRVVQSVEYYTDAIMKGRRK